MEIVRYSGEDEKFVTREDHFKLDLRTSSHSVIASVLREAISVALFGFVSLCAPLGQDRL